MLKFVGMHSSLKSLFTPTVWFWVALYLSLAALVTKLILPSVPWFLVFMPMLYYIAFVGIIGASIVVFWWLFKAWLFFKEKA